MRKEDIFCEKTLDYLARVGIIVNELSSAIRVARMTLSRQKLSLFGLL